MAARQPVARVRHVVQHRAHALLARERRSELADHRVAVEHLAEPRPAQGVVPRAAKPATHRRRARPARRRVAAPQLIVGVARQPIFSVSGSLMQRRDRPRHSCALRIDPRLGNRQVLDEHAQQLMLARLLQLDDRRPHRPRTRVGEHLTRQRRRRLPATALNVIAHGPTLGPTGAGHANAGPNRLHRSGPNAAADTAWLSRCFAVLK